MAEQKVWFGTSGPFLYDDADLLNDSDGDLPGQTYGAISTTGQLKISQPPTESMHVLRQSDIGAAGLQPYLSGEFTVTIVGYATAPTRQVRYVRIGRVCFLIVLGIAGTSTTDTFTLTGIIPELLPLDLVIMPITGQDNGIFGTKYVSLAAGSNVITIRTVVNSTTGWTPSGFKGYTTFSLMYFGVAL